MSDEHTFEVPGWFWKLGIGIALATVTLLVVWYVRHPGVTPFAYREYQDVPPEGHPSTNGHVPVAATTVSGEVSDTAQEG